MILVVDNYDSFTYNLVHYLAELGAATHVVRNDDLTAEEAWALKPQAVLLEGANPRHNHEFAWFEGNALPEGAQPLAQAYAGHGINTTHMAARLVAQAISLEQSTGFELFGRVPHMTFPGGKHLRSPLLALGMLWYRLREAVGLD